MRHARSLLAATAAWLLVSGCLKQTTPTAPQAQGPAEPPVVTVPSEGQPSAEAQPGAQPTAPPGTQGAEPGTTGAPPGMQGQPEAQPPQQAQLPTTHEVLIAALLCEMGTGQGMAMQRTEGGASEEQRCAGVAQAANVSPAQLRSGDEAAIRAVRDVVERRAGEERLDDTMKMHVLALYDKGSAAAREEITARQVADRFAISGAQRTGKTAPRGGMAPRGVQQGGAMGQPGRAAGSEPGPAAMIDPADAQALRAHDRLRDLVQYARTSDAGALATEAEAASWILAAGRFMRTEALPPRLKVLAAEPLFDTMLGVPTPPAAQGDPNRIPPTLWSQYLDMAAKTVGAMAPTGALEGDEAPRALRAKGATKPAPKPGAAGRAPKGTPGRAIGGGKGEQPGRMGAAPKKGERENMREVVMAVSQRMEALSRRLPTSDLRTELDNYVTRLRAEAGAPGTPSRGGGPGMQHPGMQMPQPGMQMPQPGMQQPGTGYPGGTQPGGGQAPYGPRTPPGSMPESPSPSMPPGGGPGSGEQGSPGSPGPQRP